jgi:hypothetical protein
MAAARLGVVLGACIALLSACGGSSDQPTRSAPLGRAADREAQARQMLVDALAKRPAVIVPRGYRIRHESASGVSIAFPRRWFALRGSDARWPGVVEMFDEYSAQLAPAIRALAVPESPLVMLAFDPRKSHGFTTNANVLVTAVKPGLGFRQWSAVVLSQARQLPSVRGRVASRSVALPAGDAFVMDFVRSYPARHGPPTRMATTQYTLKRGDRAYVLVFSTLPRLRDHYRDVFAASARSLSIAD